MANHLITEVAAATETLLGSLDEQQRASVIRPVTDDDLRHRWAYTPGPRPGLSLGELDRAQRKSVHQLLATVLSPHAYAQAATIIALEDVLDHQEGGERGRHNDDYWTVLFGTPGRDEPWGWRIEGHHVSVNLVVVDGTVSATPFFLGANPARTAYAGHSVVQPLRLEEEFARALLDRMRPAERQAAVVADTAPADLLTRNAPRLGGDPMQPLGVALPNLDPDSRVLFGGLVRLYVDRLTGELAEAEFGRIDLERLHFAWAGSSQVGTGHYYRIQGPELLIEYDNTQNAANHVHSVWRRHGGDFGDDLLAAHLAAAPH